MRVNTNVSALNAYRNLVITGSLLAKSQEKLSSGLRVNRAADDAAGLAISEKLRGQVRGLQQAIRNAQDGISLIQTAEGALNEVHAILQRLRELAVQAANDTMTSDDRNAIDQEARQLLAEIDRIANNTEFNTKKLLDGTLATNGLTFHIGANKDQNIGVTIGTATTAALTINLISLASQASANEAIASLDAAIKEISSQRAKLGAVQNRLESTISNLMVTKENLQAAESRIRDVDMALEQVNYTRLTILQQAGVAVLAQANVSPQLVLKLLG